MGFFAVLVQVVDKYEKPVAFYSAQTTPAKSRYHFFELETLAVAKAVKRFRHYLLGVSFTLITDCNSLKGAFHEKELSPRIARWIVDLKEYHYKVIHKPGSQIAFVDACSRNALPLCFNVHLISNEDWVISVQSQDKFITDTVAILLSGDQQKNKDIFQAYAIKGGKLYRNTSAGQRLVLPKTCRWQMLHKFHDDALLLIKHTSLQHTFWFPKMRRFIKKYISSCIPCSYHKSKAVKQPGYLHPINKIAIPFHTIHIDHLGPFPRNSEGKIYLFLVIDAFTKFPLIRPVSSTNTSYAIAALKEIFAIFGSPSRLICDASHSFTSQKFQDFCLSMGTHQFVNTVGVPRGNRQIERYNKTITDSIATSSASAPSDWLSHVNKIQLSLNNTLNKAINATPQELLTGYRASTGDGFPLLTRLSA